MNMLTHQEYSIRLIELFMDDYIKDITERGVQARVIDESDMKWIDRMVQVEDEYNNAYFLNHWRHAQDYVRFKYSGEFILHTRQTGNGSYYYELERNLNNYGL